MTIRENSSRNTMGAITGVTMGAITAVTTSGSGSMSATTEPIGAGAIAT